jgi:hypothetical protein
MSSIDEDKRSVTQTNYVDEKGSTTDDQQGKWWSKEDDVRVRRKLDWNIVPFLFVTYLFAFLDRSNIGNAKVAGMNAALKLDDAQYQWLLTIFYISYIVFQFLLICYKFIRPSRFMAACVFVWGLAAILQATTHSWAGLMAARWFIGMAEAGYGTGVALYLSFFFPRHEIGTRFAGFVVASAFASCIAGSLAYAIQGAQKHFAIQSWRLIFIVEAAPTLLISVLLLFMLPDSISTARFLTPHERQIAEARLYRSSADQHTASVSCASSNRVSQTIRSHFDLRGGADALRDPISYINAALLFIINVSFSAIPVYLPQILSQMGYTKLRAQAFTAPPYAASFVLAMFMTWLADKTRIRYAYMMLMTILGIVGYFMLATIKDNHVRYGAVWLVVLGLFPSVPLLYSWLLVNANGESKKGVKLVIFGTVGQCGPVLGTRLFPAKQGPYYHKGMFINASLLILALCIQTGAALYMSLWNKRKAKQFDQTRMSVGHANAQRPLQFERKIDSLTVEGEEEIHRRRRDIAELGESSIYYNYQL